jgi:hypothetical protein
LKEPCRISTGRNRCRRWPLRPPWETFGPGTRCGAPVPTGSRRGGEPGGSAALSSICRTKSVWLSRVGIGTQALRMTSACRRPRLGRRHQAPQKVQLGEAWPPVSSYKPSGDGRIAADPTLIFTFVLQTELSALHHPPPAPAGHVRKGAQARPRVARKRLSAASSIGLLALRAWGASRPLQAPQQPCQSPT